MRLTARARRPRARSRRRRLDAQAEVGDHPADQRELLVVLLAEDRDVGPDQAEQLGDHGEHAAEVAGPGLALEDVAERPGLDA